MLSEPERTRLVEAISRTHALEWHDHGLVGDSVNYERAARFNGEAHRILDALLDTRGEDGERLLVERSELEQVGLRWTTREELEAFHVSSAPRWRYEQAGISGWNPKLVIEPVYRLRDSIPEEREEMIPNVER